MGYNTKYSRLNHQEIINDFNKSKSIKEILIRHNTSEELVRKVLINHGINLPKKINITDIDPTKIIERYKELNNTQIVAKEFNLSPSSVQKILHKNNIRVSRIKYTDEEIIQKYRELKTIDSTYKVLGINENTVRKVLKKHNVKLEILKRKEIGDVFGKLTIIEEIENKVSSGGHKRRNFVLRCECGNLVKRCSLKLSEGKSWHCGCVTKKQKQIKEEKERIRKEKYRKLLIEREEKKRNRPIKPPRNKYFIGTVKDKLTILSIIGDNWKTRKFLCKCECGTIKEFSIKNFYNVKSCGCLINENRVKSSTKHGYTSRVDPNKRKWYHRWKGMIRRCYSPKMHAYPNYGGRGIKVCDRWMEPNGVGCKNYYEDIHNVLGPQPSPEHSLDRIDNDGMYEITNLRWATNSEQVKNQRRFLKKGKT